MTGDQNHREALLLYVRDASGGDLEISTAKRSVYAGPELPAAWLPEAGLLTPRLRVPRSPSWTQEGGAETLYLKERRVKRFGNGC